MKLVCVGRNYAKHAQELQNAVPEEPVLFIKPDSALLPPGHDMYLPDFSEEVHYEAELCVKIDKPCRHVEERFAPRYYSQVTVGLDFTARDLQEALKSKGLPWEKAKSFDGAAFLGEWISKEELANWPLVHFSLEINGKMVQEGDSRDMLFGVDALISYISRFFTLKTGDVIMTGTPAGVGPLGLGDKLQVYLQQQEVGCLSIE